LGNGATAQSDLPSLSCLLLSIGIVQAQSDHSGACREPIPGSARCAGRRPEPKANKTSYEAKYNKSALLKNDGKLRSKIKQVAASWNRSMHIVRRDRRRAYL
jgi:hypothetical protein